ncbi:hypothetical protein NXY47_05270 [Bacteroides fragilis]|nr:hypothetical protein [Bacteroides fragilis]
MKQISENLFTTEEQAIIARSKAEGSYMKAPNGQATNLDEKQWAQVRTRAFREWFGDWENNPNEASKVRDANGEPLVVYHGSRENFYEFKRWTDGLINSGHFFSPDRKNASEYGGNIYDVYLNLRNPLEVDAQGANFSSIEYGGEKVAASDLGNLAEMEGYDGVVISDVADSADMGSGNDRTVDYISFAANQIKSASRNTGSFLESQDDIRFREIIQDDGGKSLVGLHNITEEKLLKALKLGGLANPSAAVIDIARQSHEGYGEISLILPSSMIDKRTGRNAGTFSGDAWTPVYPQIERQFSGDGSGRVRDAISRLPQEMQPNVRSAWNSYMDGRDEGSAFAYQFLYERGEAPEFRKIEPLFGEHLRNRISAIDALDDYDERNTALLEVYIEENCGGDQTKFKDYIETRKRVLQDKIQAFPEQKQKGLAYRKAVQKLNDIEERGYEYSSVQDFYDRVKADIRQAGSVDTYHTLQDALDKIDGSEALSRQYAEWKESLADKYGIKEVLFKGYTPDGARIYLPHTLENVSGLMKRQGLAAATGWGGSFSEFAAALMKPVGTLDGIRRQKGRLTTDHSDLEAFRDKWQEVYFDLGIKLNPGGGTFDDTGLYRVGDIALKPDPGSFAKREYGVELTGEDVRQLKEMVDAIQNEYPAMYFETKFERPVYLNEFVAAVVPENVSEDVSKAVRESGLQVFVYKPKDESSRNGAVKLASEIKGVRFRLAGGTGAFTPARTASGQVFLSGDERMAQLSRHAVFLARKQHIPVNIIHSIGEVDSPRVRALIAGGKDIRGWYDIPSDRICLYLPKARGKEDIERTLLHEGVGHYGLRRLAGRKHMDAFLDDIFAGCGEKVRGEIIRLAGTGKMDIRTATEEYLAQMAESGTDARVWDKILIAFRNLLRKLGFSIEVDDRELKGLLAASRENLKRTAATRIPEKIQTPKGELELTPGYAAGSLRSKDGVRDVTPFLKEMKRAGLEPASLSPEEWKSLFSGKGIALPDGRMLMTVKEPAGYGLKITAPALRSIKTAEMEI